MRFYAAKYNDRAIFPEQDHDLIRPETDYTRKKKYLRYLRKMCKEESRDGDECGCFIGWGLTVRHMYYHEVGSLANGTV